MRMRSLSARFTICISLAALTGCGGGSAPGKELVTPQLLSGNSPVAGTGVSTKTWRIVELVGNHNYNGVAHTCPAVIPSLVAGESPLECGAGDVVTFYSNGGCSGLAKNWHLEKEIATLTQGWQGPEDRVEVIPETVHGRQRLRLRYLSTRINGQLTYESEGIVIVIEEKAT